MPIAARFVFFFFFIFLFGGFGLVLGVVVLVVGFRLFSGEVWLFSFFFFFLGVCVFCFFGGWVSVGLVL